VFEAIWMLETCFRFSYKLDSFESYGLTGMNVIWGHYRVTLS